MRVLVTTAVLTLLLPLGAICSWLVWAAADDEPEPAGTVAEGEEQEDQGGEIAESASESEAGEDELVEESDAETEEVDSSEQDLPEGVRRRPRSAEQERRYKQRKTREDPFLNPPVGLGAAAADSFYNPADWLRADVNCGVSRYMVQEESGEVIGHLMLALERESDAVLGDFIKLEQVTDLEGSSRTQLWIYSETLKPRHKEKVVQLPDAGQGGPAANAASLPEASGEADSITIRPLYQDAQRLEVEYLFDRMTIVHMVGGITARRQMRQLPFSYDVDQLPLLLRQLQVTHEEWPFEAVLCDPENETHLPMSIAQPTRVENVMTADGQVADCYEFNARVGEDQRSYFVQRVPPYKLIKYTVGPLTYTLTDYVER